MATNVSIPTSGHHVVIMGLMGVGKTTTGVLLAGDLGRPYIDSDLDVGTLVGCSGAEFAATHGVQLLHELEAAVLLGRLAADEPSVISAASSTVESELVRLALPRRAFVVRLQLSPSLTIDRQATGTHRRSMTIEELSHLSRRREPLFSTLADMTLDARRPTEELVAAVMAKLSVDRPRQG